MVLYVRMPLANDLTAYVHRAYLFTLLDEQIFWLS